MADNVKRARRIAKKGKKLDYEKEALDAIRRSWLLDDPNCQTLALMDAQAYAILHLARVVAQLGGMMRAAPRQALPLGEAM